MGDNTSSRPSGALPGPRPETLCTVRVETALFGSYDCLGRRLNPSGIFLETPDLLPLGTEARLCFTASAGVTIVAIGVVQTHYYINYNADGDPRATSGMSVRFKSFEAEKGPRTTDAGRGTLQ